MVSQGMKPLGVIVTTPTESSLCWRDPVAAVGWADSRVSGGQSQGPRRALAWQALTVPGEHSREPPSAWRLGSPLSPEER